MRFFYIVSKYPSKNNQFLLGFSELSYDFLKIKISQTIKVPFIVHLYLPCYNYEEMIQEFSTLNLPLEIFIKHEIKTLITICIDKIQSVPGNKSVTPTSSGSFSLTSSVSSLDTVGSLATSNSSPTDSSLIKEDTPISDSCSVSDTVVTDVSKNISTNSNFRNIQSLILLEDMNVKVVDETSNVGNLLNKIQAFKTNISKINKSLDSVRKIKLPPPAIIQSERIRKQIHSNEIEIFSINECKEWIKNKSINPKTGRKIEIDGPTFKKFQNTCKLYKL